MLSDDARRCAGNIGNVHVLDTFVVVVDVDVPITTSVSRVRVAVTVVGFTRFLILFLLTVPVASSLRL